MNQDLGRHPLPKIESITVRTVCVPRSSHNRITTTYGTLPDAHFALVFVTADGVTGVGEASTEQWWTGEDAHSVRHTVETFLAPVLVGKQVGIRQAMTFMNGNVTGQYYAKAAVEMALWDLLGKQSNMPLHVLLGGGDTSPVPIKYVIGMASAKQLQEQVDYGRSLGFNYFKTKVGTELSADLERVSVITDMLEPGESLGVDAQAGWSPVVAHASLKPLADRGVSFLEQPVSPNHSRAMGDLMARAELPIVAHESMFGIRDAMDALRFPVADIWALTPSTHGGISNTTDLLALARAAGIPCLLGSNIELGVSTAMMLQLAAAFPEFRECPVPSDIIGPLYHQGDVIREQPTVRDGHIEVPTGPGLGIELDLEAIYRFETT